jgi:3-oxoacyl-[acyl-carrier protein] reductase
MTMADGLLDGRIAIVTGGGGGMGGAMTLGLARAGAGVVAVDMNAEALDALTAEAEKSQLASRVVAVIADVTQAEECRAVAERARTAFGGADVLVNNAGIGMQTIRETYMTEPVRFWEAEPERWQAMVDVNFKAPFLLAREVVPAMIEAGWGRIVNVTTSLDTMLRQNYTPYGQSKAALEAATSGWAKDLADTGVTVNVLVPGGPTNTGFIPANAPFDRASLIQPGVMVAPISWLASDASDGVTDCRFVGRDWDTSLAPDEAAEHARAPAAWPNVGTTAAWPGAS